MHHGNRATPNCQCSKSCGYLHLTVIFCAFGSITGACTCANILYIQPKTFILYVLLDLADLFGNTETATFLKWIAFKRCINNKCNIINTGIKRQPYTPPFKGSIKLLWVIIHLKGAIYYPHHKQSHQCKTELGKTHRKMAVLKRNE